MNAELLERIASLERGLCSTKLQLACAKSSEDSLMFDLAKMRVALSKATSSNVAASHSESARADGAENDRSKPRNIYQAIIEVPTGNPLSRKKSGDDLDVHRARKVKKVLNPGSCASALNLYAEFDVSLHPLPEVDSGFGGELSLRRPACNNMVDRLNRNSCASALNLLELIRLPPIATQSMLSLESSISKRSSGDIALLFGNRGPSSVPSVNGRCRVGSWNNPTRVGNSRYTNKGSVKGNAEWVSFNKNQRRPFGNEERSFVLLMP